MLSQLERRANTEKNCEMQKRSEKWGNKSYQNAAFRAFFSNVFLCFAMLRKIYFKYFNIFSDDVKSYDLNKITISSNSLWFVY